MINSSLCTDIHQAGLRGPHGTCAAAIGGCGGVTAALAARPAPRGRTQTRADGVDGGARWSSPAACRPAAHACRRGVGRVGGCEPLVRKDRCSGGTGASGWCHVDAGGTAINRKQARGRRPGAAPHSAADGRARRLLRQSRRMPRPVAQGLHSRPATSRNGDSGGYIEGGTGSGRAAVGAR